jgi:hydroxymethylglutaryl-CoA lyase
MKIIESPREGMQGYENLITTDHKVRYINALLRAGFDTVEIGSIVSPRLVPQMADSLEVLKRLDLSGTFSNRMFLALNRKGADILSGIESITHISYPFSFSPTFLFNNVRSTVEDAYNTAAYVAEVCDKTGKKAVVYISYAYGNPFGDPWSMDLLLEWVEKLRTAGVKIIPLSNVSTEIGAEVISNIFTRLIDTCPDLEFGLHLHTANHDWYPKIEAAWLAGVRRFDTVINGYGGCPASGKEMLGNLMTQHLLSFLRDKNIPDGLDRRAFDLVVEIAKETYQ